jgi:hypothetical protein
MAIVHDSSGQVEWKAGKRSREWKGAALSLDKVVPFGIVGFTVRRFIDKLYFIDFSDDFS